MWLHREVGASHRSSIITHPCASSVKQTCDRLRASFRILRDMCLEGEGEASGASELWYATSRLTFRPASAGARRRHRKATCHVFSSNHSRRAGMIVCLEGHVAALESEINKLKLEASRLLKGFEVPVLAARTQNVAAIRCP